MKFSHRLARFLLWSLLAGVGGAGVISAGVYLYLKPGLPAVEQLRDVKLQTPLRIYSADRKLIAEFGEKRRLPLSYEEVPQGFIQAILAAEDARFYSHFGVDIKGLLRAAFQLASTGRIQSGGSTITMQVARNYLLTLDRTFTRKIREILLSLQIEQEMSKQEIMELYVNKIYLGNRAYGIAAAAQVYYGKEIDELNLAQLAMIAGLPKAPSRYNPLANPERALIRRDWILSRMHELGMISAGAYQKAVSAPVSASYHGLQSELNAPYVAEMVRADVVERLGEAAYTEGYRVYTTLDSEAQAAANEAVVNGLLAYDRRHGWRGAERSDIPPTLAPTAIDPQPETESEAKAETDPATKADPAAVSNWLTVLRETPTYGVLQPAIVASLEGKTTRVLLEDGNYVELDWDSMQWAKPYHSVYWAGPKLKAASDILAVGDLVRIQQKEEGVWQLGQLPQIQGALVALNPDSGAIQSLVGGFNFSHNKFNRATQAARQAGSNFKPFVYSAALEQGFTAASMINDAPVVFNDAELESRWRPQNSSGKFYGPTRLRKALYKSRNLVSIRLLQATGIRNTIDFATRFGFPAERLPKNLSLALGSAALTPLELARGYAALANGGYRVEPYFIERIEDAEGRIIYESTPTIVCESCSEETQTVPVNGRELPVAPRIADQRVIYIMNTMMQDVIKRGTGRRARALGRNDLAGKTGTTNELKDAWFSGFNRDLVTTVWVGLDQPETIGEYGGKAALPIWIDFMREALHEQPEHKLKQPSGMLTVKINPETGKRASPNQQGAIFEVFRAENAPEAESINTAQTPAPSVKDNSEPEAAPESLF